MIASGSVYKEFSHIPKISVQNLLPVALRAVPLRMNSILDNSKFSFSLVNVKVNVHLSVVSILIICVSLLHVPSKTLDPFTGMLWVMLTILLSVNEKIDMN